MRRVAVVGCGGSGKTWLSRRLAGALDAPLVHVDEHFRPDGIPLAEAEWRRVHARLVAGEAWVIDGMKLGTLAERVAAADTVVFLDVRTATCLTGLVRRFVSCRGRHRPERGEYNGLSAEFLLWILRFRRKTRPRVAALLAEAAGRGKRVIVLRTRAEARAFSRAVIARPS